MDCNGYLINPFSSWWTNQGKYFSYSLTFNFTRSQVYLLLSVGIHQWHDYFAKSASPKAACSTFSKHSDLFSQKMAALFTEKLNSCKNKQTNLTVEKLMSLSLLFLPFPLPYSSQIFIQFHFKFKKKKKKCLVTTDDLQELPSRHQ